MKFKSFAKKTSQVVLDTLYCIPSEDIPTFHLMVLASTDDQRRVIISLEIAK